MPRTLPLADHLPHDDIRRRYRACRDATERARWQVLWLKTQGRTLDEIAAATGYTPGWASALIRRVWARKGERPRVPVRPRYEWLYVYAFVCPETGEAEFWLAPSVNTELFMGVVSAFLAKREQAVMLVLDQAGWHVSAGALGLEADGVLSLRHLPPYSPERSGVRPTMPAERLWTLTDEPLANRVFERLADLEAALAERCVALTEEADRIRSLTLYHWWPGGADHTPTE